MEQLQGDLKIQIEKVFLNDLVFVKFDFGNEKTLFKNVQLLTHYQVAICNTFQQSYLIPGLITKMRKLVLTCKTTLK